MSDINSKFKYLRVKFRQNGIDIIEDVFHRFHPATKDVSDEICVFCNTTLSITKEHVIPKWLFERNTDSSFISKVNKRVQTYNKAVIPTCSTCNNSILAPIEKHIFRTFDELNSRSEYFESELCDVVRWLEILDYKLQVYDCRRKYIKYADSEYNKLWGELPVAHIRHFIDMNPFKAYDYLRSAQRRISVKKKSDRLDSLAIFDTKVAHFNFFTQPNEYIFISLPMYKLAFFYFLKKQYNHHREAAEDALYYIQKVAET